jgi:hypothetical protein
MATPSRVEPRGSHFEQPGRALASAPQPLATAHCAECAAPLALDQRYCVECGARHGPLAPAVAERIRAGGAGNRAGGAGSESPEPPNDAGASGPADGSGAAAAGFSAWFSQLAPGAIAVAVMGVLAFGVGVGWAIGPAELGSEGQPQLVAQAPPSAAATPPTPSAAPAPEASAPAATSTPESPTPAQAPSTSAASNTPASAPAKSNKPTHGSSAPAPAAPALPPVKHVFLIVLADQGEGAAYGASSGAPYLSKTLTKQGELLRGYYAVSTGELANGIALVSGQGPTPQTVANCSIFSEITPGTISTEGQALGSGCVYPKGAPTLADQLSGAGKSWRAYVEGMEDAGPGQTKSCRHPGLGSADPAQAPTPSDPYVTWRNPFVYFGSVIDSPACAQGDVGIEQLASDLASASKTPSFSYIVPDRCHDGSPQACAPGQPAGLAPAGAFLEKVVPEIELSPAYAEGSLIAITFDQAPQSGPEADSSGCCTTAPYPNLPAGSTTTSTTSGAATTTTTTSSALATGTPSGGGKVGLLLISKYVKPGTVDAVGQYNHYALLLSIENLFGLKPLGYAGAPGLLPFDKSVYNAYK